MYTAVMIIIGLAALPAALLIISYAGLLVFFAFLVVVAGATHIVKETYYSVIKFFPEKWRMGL